MESNTWSNSGQAFQILKKWLTDPRSSRIKIKKILHWNIKVELLNTEQKDKILKAGRKKRQIIYRGTKLKMTANFSSETTEARIP